MATLKRVAPILPVRDLSASLAHYQRLGFATREYDGGSYGYASRDDVEIHLGVVPAAGPSTTTHSAYLWVDDADALAQAWRAEVRLGGSACPRRIAGAARCFSAAGEQMTDPVTGCCGRDGLALRIDIGRTRAVS